MPKTKEKTPKERNKDRKRGNREKKGSGLPKTRLRREKERRPPEQKT
jgi:hypothetical protein